MVNNFIGELYQIKQWLTVKHHIPGRIRLKFSLSILKKVAHFNQFKESIQSSPLIKSYRLTISTGSLLVEYDEKIIAPYLIDQLLQDDEKQSLQALQDLIETINTAHKFN